MRHPPPPSGRWLIALASIGNGRHSVEAISGARVTGFPRPLRASSGLANGLLENVGEMLNAVLRLAVCVRVLSLRTGKNAELTGSGAPDVTASQI
jgi:hypothetical protein